MHRLKRKYLRWLVILLLILIFILELNLRFDIVIYDFLTLSYRARHHPRETFLERVVPLTLTSEEIQRLKELMADVTTLLKQNNIAYYACGGTAIGALRHGSFIPFDDDTDFCLELKYRDRLLDLIGRHPTLESLVEVRYTKVFRRRRSPTDALPGERIYASYSYRWPWIDFFFLKDNGTHLSDNYHYWPDTSLMAVDKKHIFPLTTVKMGQLDISVMRCAISELNKFIPNFMDECCHGDWNHRLETWSHYYHYPVCVPCRHLESDFVFLNRSTRAALIRRLSC